MKKFVIFLIFLLLFASSAYGQNIGPGLVNVTEEDNVPNAWAYKLVFSNGSVTSISNGVAHVTTGAGGGGDVSSDTATSVDSEIALFKSTTGKLIKRASMTGLPYITSGVLGTSKVTLTQPATGSTLTILDGKTLTVNKTITLTSPDDTSVITFPAGTVTLPSGTGTNHYWTYWTGTNTIAGKSITASKPVCSDANGDPAVCGGTEGVWQAALTNPVTGPASPTAGYLTKWDASGDVLVDGPKLGTLTDTKWCTFTTANGLQCTSNVPVTGAGDCTGGACGDGSSDGGTYYRFYDGTGNYLQIGAQASALGADKILYFPTTATNGQYLKVAVSGNTWTLTTDTPGGAGDVIGGSASASGEAAVYSDTSGKAIGRSYLVISGPATTAKTKTFTDATDTVLELSGGTVGTPYKPTGYWDWTGTAGITWPTFNQNTSGTATNATNAVNTGITDDTSTNATMYPTWVTANTGNLPQKVTSTKLTYNPSTGLISTTALTVTGNTILGTGDTATLTIRSLIAGGNSRAVQVTDSLASPANATAAIDFYVKGKIESGSNIYAPGFISTAASGNVGYIRIYEDPANGTTYWALQPPSSLTATLIWEHPNAGPNANDILTFGAVSANKTTMAFKSASNVLDFIGSTRGSVLYRGSTGWAILTPGTSGYALTSNGAGADPSYQAVTASAAGTGTELQYNNGGALGAVASSSYSGGIVTIPSLTVNTATVLGGASNYAGVSNAGAITLNGTASFTGRASTTASAGFNIPHGTAPTTPTNGDIWTTTTGLFAQINGVTQTMAPLDSPTFTTYVKLPNGSAPTVDAAGKVAVQTSSGAAGGLRIYTNATPGGVKIPIYYPLSPLTVANPTSSSNYPFALPPYNITIRAVHYVVVGGTNWVGQLQICDANYGSCSNTQTTDSTVTPGTTVAVTTFSAASVTASYVVGLKTTSVSGSPTSVTAFMDCTVDQ